MINVARSLTASLILIQLSLTALAQTGIITTYVGPGLPVNGAQATTQPIDGPVSVAVDGEGGFYVASSSQNAVYRVSADGILRSVSGTTSPGFSGDGGPAKAAKLNSPHGVLVGADGSLYIVDTLNHRVRKVAPNGIISTVAGNGNAGFSGDGGPATSASLNKPFAVTLDPAGNLYVSDTYNHRVRKVTPAGVISTVAGNGKAGFSGDGGPATAAMLNDPVGITVDKLGNLYVADWLNQRVRKVTPAGVISTVAGIGTAGFSGDGGPATAAQLSHPSGVALDSSGNLFIAEYLNHRIRRVQSGAGTMAFFPQVAVGGGYTTVFTFGNSGSDLASGILTLSDQQGGDLTVSGLVDSPGNAPFTAVASSFSLQIPPGGVGFVTATSVAPGEPARSGWGQMSSLGGDLYGVATFQYMASGSLQSIAGVLPSQPTQYATIPVDYDVDQGRFVGYAIANPGGEGIEIKLAVIDQLGNVVDDSIPMRLVAGQQVSRFLHQDLTRRQFKGSMVFRGQNGKTFIVVALIQNQGRLTVIPVQAAKAQQLPN